MNVECSHIVALLKSELHAAEGFFKNDVTHCQRLSDPAFDSDGLEDLAKQVAYNRRLMWLHLNRAEAILTAIYPALSQREMGWMSIYELEAWIKKLEDTGEAHPSTEEAQT